MATIPILNCNNYNVWCVKMRTLFLSMDLWDIVENGYEEPKAKSTMSEPQEIQSKENQRKDAAALSKIQQAVSDSIFPKIMEATNAKEAWDILRQEFRGDVKDQNLNETKEDQPTQQCHLDHMDSKLYTAAMEGDINVLRENEGQLNVQVTPNKNTILHIAALFGNANSVREILTMNSSLLSRVNSKGDTALHLAAMEGHLDVVDILISFAKDLDRLEQERGSKITKEMLRAKNDEGDTALHNAVRNCPEMVLHGQKLPKHVLLPKPILVKLLIKEEEDAEFTYTANIAGETPLYIAAERGYREVVSEILKTCRATYYGGPGERTALHAVIIHNHQGITKELLEWNKDLAWEPDMYGWTPLHYAARFGHIQSAKELLDVDKSIAYITTADKDDKNTALHVAACHGHVGVMEELISQCPDCWEMVNGKGQNILHVAVKNEKKVVVKFLLKKLLLYSLINQKDVGGNTPLHLLVATNLFILPLVTVLQTDWMVFNKDNWAPLDIIKYPGNVTSAVEDKIKYAFKRLGASEGLRNVISKDNELLTNKRKALAMEKKSLPEDMKKSVETDLIVATLIATVTFAAGFTMPGGYNSNDGPNQGMAILTREAAFKAFVVTDTIAMILATCAIFIYFGSTDIKDLNKLTRNYSLASFLVMFATGSMVLAFLTGTYGVLAHSSGLAISVCIICSLFVLIFYKMIQYWFHKALEVVF